MVGNGPHIHNYGLCRMRLIEPEIGLPDRLSTPMFNWHDRAMLFEQYHWKRAMKKNQRYEFMWNKTWDKATRDSYYFNWPLYFP